MTDEPAIPEMVERVAKALCRLNFGDPEMMTSSMLPIPTTRDGSPMISRDWIVPLWHRYVTQAIGVIDAIRVPTAAMQIAGTEQWLCEAAMEDRSAANWTAMIDAALRCPPE